MFNVSLDVVDFHKEIRAAAEEAELIAEEDVQGRIDLAVDLLRKVTPVDTGYARSRWKVKRYLLVPGGEITNDADYILRLNQGHSQQAPKFFIEQALIAARII
ncbi:hypothetical protein KNU84_gp098 [Bacteriophage DSS3_VP1]|uniref:Uncharacterized protein n=1 Tax=Bacteriophage DSS3_VP1 TaxID=2664196 RepID=A0A7S5FQA6_9CAUD|nr:hypothetical protein KNU84_gp098 [Bacteriophage DSS3_VP1]QGH74606.1 hypothetical protein DSS3VP1_00038 [Bacteriophage DSS3_VP1]